MSNKQSRFAFLNHPKDFNWFLGVAIALSVLAGGVILLFGIVGFLLPIIAAGFIVAAPIQYFTQERQKGAGFLAAALEGFRAMLVYPFMALALGAPARLIVFAGYHFFFRRPISGLQWQAMPWFAKTLFFWPPFEMAAAGCGIAFGVIATAVTIYLILKQVQQVDNLPTSKARSAALGLSEFKGVARALDDSKLEKTETSGAGLRQELSSRGGEPILFSSKRVPVEPNQPIQNMHKRSRFYLEDDTGRILVDPTAADFWDGGNASFLEPVCKILLTRRVEESHPPLGDSVTVKELLPGDPVYVLGNVEVNPEAPRDAADSERLIVRPSTAPIQRSALNWLFFNNEPFIKSRDYRYLFLLSDAYEYQLAGQLFRGIYSILIPGAIWTFGSLLLLWFALKLI